MPPVPDPATTSVPPGERGRTVLLVAQHSPPSTMSATRRTAGLTKYLARLGHRVVVLTSKASGEGPVEHAARTIRTGDLIASRINPRRRHFEALAKGSDSTYAAGVSPFALVAVPDLALIGWLPYALPAALRAVRDERPDCVITTSPPESAHLIGMALRRRGVPWIADLRDGWRYETTHPDWPLRLQHRIDDGLERAVVRRADAVVAVTEPISADLRARHGVPVDTIPNGFDPDERVAADPADVGLPADRHTIVHTGRMAVAGRDPTPFLTALRLVRERRPELAGRLDAVFAGPLTDDEQRLFADADGSARAIGTLPRKDTLALQSAAGTLLLLTGRGRRSEATAKLYEYLATDRPILVLGEDSAAAAIVRETGRGEAVSAEDPEAIAGALEQIAAHGFEVGGGSGAQYGYDRISERMADLVERVATA
jgi:glycosyltransferase involved in cell wall biosynthesis